MYSLKSVCALCSYVFLCFGVLWIMVFVSVLWICAPLSQCFYLFAFTFMFLSICLGSCASLGSYLCVCVCVCVRGCVSQWVCHMHGVCVCDTMCVHVSVSQCVPDCIYASACSCVPICMCQCLLQCVLAPQFVLFLFCFSQVCSSRGGYALANISFIISEPVRANSLLCVCLQLCLYLCLDVIECVFACVHLCVSWYMVFVWRGVAKCTELSHCTATSYLCIVLHISFSVFSF